LTHHIFEVSGTTFISYMVGVGGRSSSDDSERRASFWHHFLGMGKEILRTKSIFALQTLWLNHPLRTVSLFLNNPVKQLLSVRYFDYTGLYYDLPAVIQQRRMHIYYANSKTPPTAAPKLGAEPLSQQRLFIAHP